MCRHIFIVCFAFILIFVGCNPKKPADPVSVDFTCDFEAHYQNLTAAGTLTRHTAGTLLLKFSKPETLDGLSAEWDGEKVTLNYLGLSYNMDPDKLPESALGESLVTALDVALRGEGERQESDKSVTVSGLSGTAQYTYVYDAKTGVPLSLKIPSIPLTVTFSNVQTT